MIRGLNHLTLAVADLDRSIAFYTELLGFSTRIRKPASAYPQAGTLWLALVVDARVRQGPLPEYSHVAFTVTSSDFPLLIDILTRAGIVQWQESDRSDSFYFLDPDGHKLELHSGDLASRLPSTSNITEASSEALLT